MARLIGPCNGETVDKLASMKRFWFPVRTNCQVNQAPGPGQRLTVLTHLFLGFGGSPAALGSVLRDFLALFGGKRIGSGTSALKSAFAAKGDGGLVFVRVFGGRWRAVFDLAGENIPHQLT